VFGPLKLPDPKLPDIDVLIKDAKGTAVLIGEIKWLRKPIRAIGNLDRDAELGKGFQQLRDVREFLERSPDYLKERFVIEKDAHQASLSYAVIARDHLSDIPQPEGFWLTEFDALVWALQKSESLTEAIRKLQSYEWLPVEGRDFMVRLEPPTVTGMTIDVQVFHRLPGSMVAGFLA
jgi:hypothetical protein